MSLDYLSPVGSYLLGVAEVDDPDVYAGPVSDFVQRMIEDGDKALQDALDERGVRSPALLAGLPPELVRGVACAWAKNQEYETPSDSAFGGWRGDGVTLRYVPMRHGDRVVKAWLDVAARGGEHVSEEMRDALLAPDEGPGACTKCHSISTAPGEASGENPGNSPAGETEVLKVEWQPGVDVERAFVRYEHGPHLNLLGPGSTCETCHTLNSEADFASGFEQYDPATYESNFNPIRKETCATCHAERQVTQQCTLCHDYHKEPGFNRRMMTVAGERSGPQ